MGRFSAEGAEFESGIHGFVTAPTSTVRDGIQGLAASIADQHGHALFDPHKGDKKQAEIMIDALGMSCFQTATGTEPRIFIECFGFGLNTGDQEHVDIAF